MIDMLNCAEKYKCEMWRKKHTKMLSELLTQE